MLVTVLALICSLSNGNCIEKTVTNSDLGYVSMQGCLMGAPQLAEWMKQYPGYRLQSWRCRMGELPKKEQI